MAGMVKAEDVRISRRLKQSDGGRESQTEGRRVRRSRESDGDSDGGRESQTDLCRVRRRTRYRDVQKRQRWRRAKGRLEGERINEERPSGCVVYKYERDQLDGASRTSGVKSSERFSVHLHYRKLKCC